MLQPSQAPASSFDVDAQSSRSASTQETSGSLASRMKGLFSMVRSSGNGYPPDPGTDDESKHAGAAAVHSQSAEMPLRPGTSSLEARPPRDEHVQVDVDMLGEHK